MKRTISIPLKMNKEESQKCEALQKAFLDACNQIVPLAIPLVCGPAVIATVMLYSHQAIGHFVVLGAILIAWIASTIILLSSAYLKKVLGEKGLSACEKLTGLILVMLSVQMFLNALPPLFHK